MKIIMEKIAKGEALTPEELAKLAEFQKTVELKNSEIEKLSAEKTELESKFTNANNVLQEKMAELTAKDERIAFVEAEKASIEKIIRDNDSKITMEEKIRINREKAEQIRRAEQIRQAEELANKALADKEAYNNKLKAELEELKALQAKTAYKNELILEKSNRPYLAKEIDGLIAELETSGVENTKMIHKFLVAGINHDEAMEKFKAISKAGTNILDDKKVLAQDKEVVTKTDEQIDDDIIMQFAKKNNFKVR